MVERLLILFVYFVCLFVLFPQGSKLQFECSFNVEYDDVNDSEALKWNIDSVSMVPKDCKRVESVYSVETDQLTKVTDYIEVT